jgi:kinesin family protein 11
MNTQLEAKVGEYASIHDQFTLDLSSQLQEFQQREEDKLRNNREFVQQKVEELQALTKQSGEDQKQNKKTVDGLVEDIRRESEALVSAAEDRNAELRQVCQRLAARIVASNKEALVGVKQNMEEMADLYLSSLKVTRDQLTQDRKSLEDVQSITQEAMQKELGKVNDQNARLQLLLEEEKEKADGMREKMVKNISQMLVNFAQERQDSMQNAFTEINEGNAARRGQVQLYSDAHSSKLDGLLESNRASRENVKEREKAAKGQKMKSEAGMNQLDNELQALTTEVCNGSQGALQDLQQTVKSVQVHSGKLREICETSRTAQDKQLTRVTTSAEEGLNSIDGEIESTMEDVQETCEGMLEGMQDYGSLGATFLQDASSQLSIFRETTRDYLSGKMRVDTPTGATPQKKDYPSSTLTWSLVPASKKRALRQETKRKLMMNGDRAGGGSLSDSMIFTDDSDSNQEGEGEESERGRDDDDDDDVLSTTTTIVNDAAEDGSADQTLTKARLIAAVGAGSTITAPVYRKVIRPSTAASNTVPLRESTLHHNRLSIARGGVTATSKMRQPKAALTQIGSLAKRARQ